MERGRHLVIIVCCALALSATSIGRDIASPPIASISTILENGLRVVISENHAAPVVSIAVNYDVGSRDEIKGRTGIAHLFEHLMFEGSSRVAAGEHVDVLFRNGGRANAFTEKERTMFVDTVPANQLEAALFLEADRMRSLQLSADGLARQRQVVHEERRQRRDNQPYGRAEVTLDQLTFDAFAHQHPISGTPEDVDALTLVDCEQFFKAYYSPNNAVLAIAGDVDRKTAVALVKRHFGSVGARVRPASTSSVELPLATARRTIVVDQLVRAPRIDIGYRIPASGSAADAALVTLANIIGTGTSSRLYNAVVRRAGAASAVSTTLADGRSTRLLRITAIVAAGHTADEVESAIVGEVERLAAENVEAWELEKARSWSRREAAAIADSSLRRAMALADATLFLGESARLNERLTGVDALRVDDLKQAAARYLRSENRAVVITEAPPPSRDGARPAATSSVGASAPTTTAAPMATPRHQVPIHAAPVAVSLPSPTETTIGDGLRVTFVPADQSMVGVHVSVMGAGGSFDPDGRAGVAALTASVMRESTASRSSYELAKHLDRIAATLTVTAGASSPEAVLSGSSSSDRVGDFVDLLADVIVRPAFRAEDVEAAKRRMQAALAQQRTTPGALAVEWFARLVYGTRPGPPAAARLDDIQHLTREDVVAFHRERYVPEQATLTIGGRIPVDQARKVVTAAFANWRRRGAAVPMAPTATSAVSASDAALAVIDRPGSSQTTLVVGADALARADRDYETFSVLNQIVGSGPTSRLFRRLRTEKAMVYSVASNISASRDRGDWQVTTSVRSDLTAAVVADVQSELSHVRTESVARNELSDAKRSIVASVALSLETSSELAVLVSLPGRYGLARDYWSGYARRIEAITADDVRRVAQKYLAPERLRIVAVGDGTAIAPALAAFGPVATYDADGRLQRVIPTQGGGTPWDAMRSANHLCCRSSTSRQVAEQ